MTLVRIIKDWERPNLMRQTKGGQGAWEGVRFTLDPVERCDYVVVLNRVPEETHVTCHHDHIWAVIQEPPVPEYEWLRRGFDQFHRILTPDTTLQGATYTHSQPALPWHIERDFDFLSTCSVPDKSKVLSWITSDATGRKGHRTRMEFLGAIQGKLNLDLFGRGFATIEDKWFGLAPYRYSLAIENHSGPYYWTEKLADCFLAWTMPIYYGCTNITDYFPKESMIRIDITDPSAALAIIKEAIASDTWRRNIDAIAAARDLVLNRWQLFPFVVEQIASAGRAPTRASAPSDSGAITLRGLPYLYPIPFQRKLRGYFGHSMHRLRSRLFG